MGVVGSGKNSKDDRKYYEGELEVSYVVLIVSIATSI